MAPRSAKFNRFTGLFGDALERCGANVVAYKPWLADIAQQDIVLYHWPHRLFEGEGFLHRLKTLTRLLMARWRRNTRIVWVAHNVTQHEGNADPSLMERLLVRNLDGIVYLSETSRNLVHSTYSTAGGIVELVTVHGAYESEPPQPFLPPGAREPVRLLNFGLVRPYKNLDDLVRAAGQLDAATAEVTICGRRHDREYARTLDRAAAGLDSVRMALSDDIVPDKDLDRAIDASHGVVLPYRDILHSGAAIHALSRGRPVLVPAIGAMPELAELMGDRWVQLYADELTVDVLDGFARHARTIPASAVPDLEQLSWQRVERDLSGFLARLMAV
ncbi:glycosyltransferase [Qipengyuania qiaonensis]|uniref:glycosyltransferase n=1 Tax=Qipengyuania qiaonensis TaxID=2867240 RepID=UPI001C869E5E|nr:glycosyltransferase [Qipengyuania qiaonensis]